MSRSKPESLLTLTQSFFHNYLQGTRGASAHTLRAYRDALKLFFLFLSDRKHKTVADLSLEDVQAETVLAFLDHIEAKRSNSAVTRNCRLAAVRSFVQHLLRQDVTRAGQYSRILAIRTKRATRRTVTYNISSPRRPAPLSRPSISIHRAATATTPCCCFSITLEPA